MLFDFDGTLTAPLLDFAQIRRDMGIAPGRPILEALREMTPDAARAATEILLRHERHAAEHATLNPGASELLARLSALDIPAAIVTRNTLASARQVIAALGITVAVLVTREDEPCKPHPAPLLLALRRLHLDPATLTLRDVWMVGDGEHDIMAGHAAGCFTVYLSHGRPLPPACPLPDLTIQSLHELLALLPT